MTDRTERSDWIDREIDRALGEAPPSGLSADFTQRVSAQALRKQVHLPDFAIPAALAGLAGMALIPSILDEPQLALTASTFLVTAAGVCATWAFGQIRATLAERSTILARTSSPVRP